MADTSFTARVTSIVAVWLNQVNAWTFWGRRPNYATTTGSANAQVLTLETGSLYSAGSEADGDEFWFKAGFTNTAATTLQVLPSGGSNTAVAAQMNQVALGGGEIQLGRLYKAIRLSNTWQLSSAPSLLSDAQALLVNAADITKKLRFSLSGITTATTRIVTWADQNLTFAALAAKGDSWWASAAGILSTLTVGSNAQIVVADSTQTAGVRWADPWSKGMISGCQLTWVSTTSYTMGAGTCRDDADTETMKVASAITMSNLTVGWVVGNNQPKIRTGVTLSNGMTLHAYVIKRVDTNVVDWFFTDEASNPTLPTNYTKSRRVASRVFSAGAQTFAQVFQSGDLHELNASVQDVATGNPGANAVTATLASIPTGINFLALIDVGITDTVAPDAMWVSSLTVSDQAPSATAAPGFNVEGQVANRYGYAELSIRTNTSAQIRYRCVAGGVNSTVKINTKGWIDGRGKD